MDKEELNGCTSNCGTCSGCGHDHSSEDMEGFSPIITLIDENGNNVKFEILDVVILEDGKEYLVVAEATDEEKDDVEVTILEIKDDNGEEVYDTVTDDSVASKVFEEFQKQQEEMEE